MSTGLKANSDGSAAIQVGGSDVITLTSGGAATFLTSPTTVQAGTAAAPAITTSGDTNTGIFFPAADTIAFAEGGVESMRIDSNGTLTYAATTIASYLWTSWSPTNLTGTVTNAPSTGTADDSNYVTMSNSSGTLTITFDVAGKYLICIQTNATHANAYTLDTFYTNLGGTATRRIGINDPQNWGDSVNDGNISITTSFYVSATATQTLTIQPQYRVSAGGGTASQHTAYCNATIQYCGG
jgi:hypothetical protein